jgi:hypothetical protein
MKSKVRRGTAELLAVRQEVPEHFTEGDDPMCHFEPADFPWLRGEVCGLR